MTTKIKIKFVKKARLWVRTEFVDGEQKLTWYDTKKEAEEGIKK